MWFLTCKRPIFGHWWVVLLALVRSFVVFAQSGDLGVAQQSGFVRANTRVVEVNVVVLDKKGVPIAGLTKDDFTILDSNVPQTIALFAQEGGPRSRQISKALPSNVYTNQLDPNRVPGDVTVVLLDALNTPTEDQPFARSQVVTLLGRLQPQDHVAIYVLNSSLYVLHDFTQDMGALIAAVQTYKLQSQTEPYPRDEAASLSAGGAPANPQGTADPGKRAAAQAQQARQQLRDFMDTAAEKQQNMAAINRVETTTAAFEAIANHLASVPGRKNLVWVSGSFPVAVGLRAPSRKYSTQDAHDFEGRLERITRALNQADIAVYPVDARGLTTSVSFDAEGPLRGEPQQGQEDTKEQDPNGFGSMDLLAERTGGRTFHNSNDLTAAVRQALVDGEISYSLAFYPSHNVWDGKYHALKVRVDRPEAQLTYRRGYFAVAEVEQTEAEQKSALAEAVASPINATNLTVFATLSPAIAEPTRSRDLVLTLDVHEITFFETKGGKSCLLEFLFVQRNDAGKLLAGEEKKAPLVLSEQKYDSLLKSGMVITHRLVFAQEVTEVRVVIRDQHSGAVGSLTVPVTK